MQNACLKNKKGKAILVDGALNSMNSIRKTMLYFSFNYNNCSMYTKFHKNLLIFHVECTIWYLYGSIRDWVLSSFHSQTKRSPGIPFNFSFLISSSCQTLSKSYEISQNTNIVDNRSSKFGDTHDTFLIIGIQQNDRLWILIDMHIEENARK